MPSVATLTAPAIRGFAALPRLPAQITAIDAKPATDGDIAVRTRAAADRAGVTAASDYLQQAVARVGEAGRIAQEEAIVYDDQGNRIVGARGAAAARGADGEDGPDGDDAAARRGMGLLTAAGMAIAYDNYETATEQADFWAEKKAEYLAKDGYDQWYPPKTELTGANGRGALKAEPNDRDPDGLLDAATREGEVVGQPARDDAAVAATPTPGAGPPPVAGEQPEHAPAAGETTTNLAAGIRGGAGEAVPAEALGHQTPSPALSASQQQANQQTARYAALAPGMG